MPVQREELARRGQLSCPQDGPVGSRRLAPVRQLPTAPRSFAFGLTRCACQTAIHKKFKKSEGEITRKYGQSQTGQTVDNLAVLPGGI
jgi:hypothetical protein